MKFPPIACAPGRGPVTCRVRVERQHPAAIAADIWSSGEDGKPASLVRRIQPRPDGEILELGDPAELAGRLLDLSIVIARPPGSREDWKFEIIPSQRGQTLAGYPRAAEGPFPPEENSVRKRIRLRLAAAE
ncbi:MAG: hypothetical protein GMKNLPBB_00806 [Myxococcota bacterium]|nr:hypothetical protein [Myxococcota bacterium]